MNFRTCSIETSTRTRTLQTSSHRRMRQAIELKGIGVSPGVVVGPSYLMTPAPIEVVEREIAPHDTDEEIRRFEGALIETRRQIIDIQTALEQTAKNRDGSILDAHLMVLDDRSLIEEMVERVRGDLLNIEFVVKEACDKYAASLAAVRDEYLRERVADVRDVGRRLIRNLTGNAAPSPLALPSQHIIVSDDLAPSETAALRRDEIIGFATDLGSQTSHTAVMARALEIPAVVGLHDVTEQVVAGDRLLIDGTDGIVIINPSDAQLERYGEVAANREHIETELGRLRNEPAATSDGHRTILSANVERLEDVPSAINYGAEGVGLFRTEFLFLSSKRMLTEVEQTDVYLRAAELVAPAPMIFRTMDLGGDKFFSQMEMPRENNPFLGCRSIRLSLRHPEVFKEQIRAILRASRIGNVKLMFPLISTLSEVMQARAIVEEAKRELDAAGDVYDPAMEIGIMIEIPVAALNADVLARHVDFFSIGTNDLIQYTLAVDRGNEQVAYLYEPTNPAVLRLIQMTIDASHRAGIWTGVCGEMAGDPLLVALLLGMGVDEISVNPRSVPLVKDVIRNLAYTQAQALAKSALMCDDAASVMSGCRDLIREVAPEILELV
jgi:phosphotransferase system enzyme I (PtsI)